MIAQDVVVVSIWSYCFADNYRTLLTNKAWWGSSLARCCRLAVAPKYGKLSVFTGSSMGFDVTGLISGIAVAKLVFGMFNHE